MMFGASKDLILVHTLQLKPMIKAAHSSRWTVSSGIIDLGHSKKTHLKKLMGIMIIIIINKSQK